MKIYNLNYLPDFDSTHWIIKPGGVLDDGPLTWRRKRGRIENFASDSQVESTTEKAFFRRKISDVLLLDLRCDWNCNVCESFALDIKLFTT